MKPILSAAVGLLGVAAYCQTALAEMVNAVNAGDAKRYAAAYAQNAAITIYGSGALKGRDAVEQHEVELLREFPTARPALYGIWRKGALGGPLRGQRQNSRRPIVGARGTPVLPV